VTVFPGDGGTAGDGEQVLNHRGGPEAGGADGFHDPPLLLVQVRGHEEEIGITDDPREDVVEIVGDAPGEQPQPLELLDPGQFPFLVRQFPVQLRQPGLGGQLFLKQVHPLLRVQSHHGLRGQQGETGGQADMMAREMGPFRVGAEEQGGTRLRPHGEDQGGTVFL